MHKKFFLIFLASLLVNGLSATGQTEMEELLLKTFPEGPILRGDIIASRGQYDALIHSFAIMNMGKKDITIDRIILEVTDEDDQVQAQHYMAADDIQLQARRHKHYYDSGVFKRFDSVFGFSFLFGATFQLSETAILHPDEGLIFFQKYFAVGPTARAIRVRAVAHTTDGQEIAGETTVPITIYQSANTYQFPLSGSWFVNVGPDAGTHHRWSQSSEFAIDAIRVSSEGKAYTGEGSSPDDYFAYGAPVFAAADGIVVRAVDGANTAPVKQPEESYNEYFNRMSLRMNKFFDEDAEQMKGNYVVIQHEGGEYSSYIHLKAGSVSVMEGQAVNAGEKIGEVGHSGNSMEPHLHFNVGLGPDPLTDRSVPVVFGNLSGRTEENLKRPLRSGEFVSTKPPADNP